MGDYGRTSGTGGPQSAAITNDDDTSLDLPETITEEWKDAELSNYMDRRAY